MERPDGETQGLEAPAQAPTVAEVRVSVRPSGSRRESMDWDAARANGHEDEAHSSPPCAQGRPVETLEAAGTRQKSGQSPKANRGRTEQSSSPRSASTTTRIQAQVGGAPGERIDESQPAGSLDLATGSININHDLVTVTRTDSLVFGSMGEASAAFHPRLRISTQEHNLQATESKPRTPSMTPSGSGIPVHLQAKFIDWIRLRNLEPSNGGFLTPQARKLSALDSATRRQEISGSRCQGVAEIARQLRSSVLQNKRSTPKGTSRRGLTEGEELNGGARGQLIFQEDTVTNPPQPPP
jgi:hypothetical protein